MKKQLLFIAIAGMFTSMASATDLYVRDLGAGGAYPTISAAITAAVDGDRIIIKPKIGNAPYLETVTINKSLTFLSENNFAKYYVKGAISIVPAVGRVVTINNMYAFQSDIVTSTTTLAGGRATVNIINCTVDGGLTLDNTQRVTANIFSSRCSGIARIVHGKVTGSFVEHLRIYEDAAPLATTDISIIGNEMPSGCIYDSTDYAFAFTNNDVAYTTSVAASGNSNLVLYGFDIAHMKVGSTNNVLNNRIYNETSGVTQTNRYAALYCEATESCVLYVANNILVNLSVNGGQDYALTAFNPTPTVVAVNNFSTKNMVFYGVDTQADNISNGTYDFDFNNNISTGGIVNTGINDDEYADIDLSRNDIGIFGGSNSWVNFYPPNAGNRPRVTYLNTPRRIYNGTTAMPVEATGISK
ncbi:hypothetical protein [Flavobacterium wongokense]|uniref:hypothetical protein n=1 Tax=Flavobacterium wongokense TaxID=2910674 RepID=UPI001F29630A|nr:hypothetical protein [Flavobacterium sp. WG47]MCF6131703.1 hypothetical protein [Flavobacterium sp. WG47]